MTSIFDHPGVKEAVARAYCYGRQDQWGKDEAGGFVYSDDFAAEASSSAKTVADFTRIYDRMAGFNGRKLAA
jgi:hypothetical protein